MASDFEIAVQRLTRLANKPGIPKAVVEQEPTHFATAVRRIKAELAQPRLFTAPEAVRSKNGLRYNADAVRAVLRGKAGKK